VRLGAGHLLQQRDGLLAPGSGGDGIPLAVKGLEKAPGLVGVATDTEEGARHRTDMPFVVDKEGTAVAVLGPMRFGVTRPLCRWRTAPTVRPLPANRPYAQLCVQNAPQMPRASRRSVSSAVAALTFRPVPPPSSLGPDTAHY